MRLWPTWMPHPALVFVVVAWGFNFSIIKIVLAELDASVAALVRYCVMLPVLFMACKALSIPLKYPEGQKRRYIFAGFIANGVYMVFFLEGMQTAGAAQGAIVLATSPIWIGLFAILKKQEVFTKHLAFGGLLAFAGAVMVIAAGGGEIEGSTQGALLVLISAVIWAWSVVLMQPLVTSDSPFAVFTLTFPGGLIALLPYGIKATVETDWSALKAHTWWALAYLVLVAGVGSFSAYYKGLADVGPAKTGMVQFFIPPSAAFFAWAVFSKPVGAWQIVGMAVVVAGTLVASGRLFEQRATS